MIKQEIIEKISQFFKLTTYDAEKIVDDIFLKIMLGVKDDNIIDIANFGEFIIKYNNGKNGTPAPYKKTIEFLPSTILEEEVGHKNYDLIRTRTTPAVEETIIPQVKPETKQNETAIKKVEETVKKPEVQEYKEPLIEPEKKSEEKQQIKPEPVIPSVSSTPVGSTSISSTSEISTGNIEDDFKKKREALLSKISIHPLQDSERVKKPETHEFHYNIPQEKTPAKQVVEEQKKEPEVDLQKQELLKKQEEEKKILAAEEEKRKIEEETKRRAQEVEAKQRLQEEEKKILAAEEEKRKIEEEAKRRAQEEEAKRRLQDEAAKQRLQEEEAKRKLELEAKQKEEAEKKIVPPVIPLPIEEDISQKSFADYFTEVKSEDKFKIKPEEKVPAPSVIPKEAVELHQQITSAAAGIGAFPTQTIQTADQFIEHRADDKSYYIWYKESEPNVNETQTMSYEYELLYQATKEAEYKSKLRIYVTTFILFFSIVLVLLIFSPVIYKVFFTPPAENQENIQNNESQNPNGPTSYDQKATLNVPPISINQNNVVADTINNTQNNTQNTQSNVSDQNQTSQQQENKQPPPANVKQPENPAAQQESAGKTQSTQTQTPQQQNQQNTNPKVDGISKSTVGWSDEKLKVIFVQLENGKFAIQESAWDSDAKANKRISLVESLKIEGMKGTVIKADLGNKGVWYRTRFGEFNTLDEAKQKAEELRTKEKVRLQAALLMYFLLYA